MSKVRVIGPPAVLADAAHVYSAPFHLDLKRLSRLIKPHLARLEAMFARRLRGISWARHYDRAQLKALFEITAGAAARILAAEKSITEFFEQVEYNGRRLAKLNVAPVEALQALREYDQVLDTLLANRFPGQEKVFQAAREQLHWSVVLTLNNSYYQVREAETQAFYGLFRAEQEAANLEDLLRRFVAILTRTFRAQMGRMLLLGLPGGEIAPKLAKKLARPHYIERGAADEELILDPALRGAFQSYWSIPFYSKKRLAGVIQFGFQAKYGWLPRELQLLEAVAERCLVAAERARLIQGLAASQEQIRRLAAHMLQVEQGERQRISRELHDEAGQSLLLLRLQLEMLEKSLAGDVRERLGDIRQIAERTIEEIRRIVAALAPAVLEQLSLVAALRQLVQRLRRLYPFEVRLRVSIRGVRLPSELEAVIYRLVQECLQNAARHSGASTVKLSLWSTDQFVELSIRDDGIGFDVDAALTKPGSFGLAGMQQRVALLGGRLEIRSRPGQGSTIRVQLPVETRLPTAAGSS